MLWGISRRIARDFLPWLCLLAACTPAPSAPHEPAPAAPNVLLLSIDTLRADHLGCYGYGRPTSPHIDRLAAEGTLFEHAFAPSSWTLPSHTTLLSGLGPRRHGAVRRDLAIPQEVPWLPEILRRSGYATAAVVNAPFVHADYGFDRGFERYEYVRRDREPHQAAVLAALREAARPRQGGERRPFFLFFHYMSVHSPYRPESAYQRFAPPEPPSQRVRGRRLDRLREALEAGAPPLETAEVAYLEALYDGEILSVDARVGEVLALLDEMGLADETVVLLTADHGEEFLEHGGILHNRTLYDEALAVPLIVRGPGVPSGVRAAVLASLADVLPTVLGLARIPLPADLDGVDLARFWRPGAPAADGGRILELWTSAPDGEHPRAGLRSAGAKLIADPRSGELELYDLLSDPGETADLARSPGAEPAPGWDGERLLRRFRELAWPDPENPGGRAGEVELDEEDVQRLKALGYL